MFSPDGDFEFSEDCKERDTIIFGEPKEWDGDKSGGIEPFDELTAEQLLNLIVLCHADPETCQNNSPSIGDFLKFLEANPKFRAHGYVVSPDRNDYRVSIEGITYEGDASKEEIITFVSFCNGADELDLDNESLRAWWD